MSIIKLEKDKRGNYLNPPKINQPVLCWRQWYDSRKMIVNVLKKVDEDDCDWRIADDNNEISYSINVLAYMLIPEFKQ